MSDYPNFVHYAEIDRLGHENNYGILSNEFDEIVIEEKIDGGNAQFRRFKDPSKGAHILFGTRNNHFVLHKDSGQKTQFGENARWVYDIVKDEDKLDRNILLHVLKKRANAFFLTSTLVYKSFSTFHLPFLVIENFPSTDEIFR